MSIFEFAKENASVHGVALRRPNAADPQRTARPGGTARGARFQTSQWVPGADPASRQNARTGKHTPAAFDRAPAEAIHSAS
jgi:hypothetical protein